MTDHRRRKPDMWDLPFEHGPVALWLAYGAILVGLVARSLTVGFVALGALWVQTWLCMRYASRHRNDP